MKRMTAYVEAGVLLFSAFLTAACALRPDLLSGANGYRARRPARRAVTLPASAGTGVVIGFAGPGSAGQR